MYRISFLNKLFFIGIIFIFGKIYRHNAMVRVRYEEQRLDRLMREFSKKKALLVYHLHKAKNYRALAQWARDKRSMGETLNSHVITLTTGLSCEI